MKLVFSSCVATVVAQFTTYGNSYYQPQYSPYQPYQPQAQYNPLTTAVVANAVGGGLQGALLANNLQGNAGYGGNNLGNTLLLSSALGGSGLGGSLGTSSTLGNVVLASALTQPQQPQYYPGQPYYPQNNNNNLLNTYATASLLGGSGLGTSSGLGSGLGNVVLASALTQPQYPGQRYSSGNNNLLNTYATASLLGGTTLGGTGSSNLAPVLIASSLNGGGGFGNNALTQGLVANQLGGGLQGALLANQVSGSGRGSFGGNNLGTTLLVSGALGGSSALGGSNLTPLLLASSLNNNQPTYGRGGYGGYSSGGYGGYSTGGYGGYDGGYSQYQNNNNNLLNTYATASLLG
jgi:hypothetical protein